MKWLLLVGALLAGSCATTGDEIVACGQRFAIGTPVVLWDEPGGYGSGHYSPIRRSLPTGLRERVQRDGWALDDLRRVVRMFVLHFDMAGTSKRCAEILEKRKLSVHFMLDVDGTIYQTVDLKERAWHATVANDHSVGIEIAHPGAYPAPGHPVMRQFYEREGDSVRGTFPKWAGEPGIRTAGYVPRPARPDLVDGTINGRRVYMYDFTPAQYQALAKLTTALRQIFPRIRNAVPRDDNGAILTNALPKADLAAFEGVLGHYHVQTNKVDPGPAFDWGCVVRQ